MHRSVDGRLARGDRTRTAVLDAAVALATERGPRRAVASASSPSALGVSKSGLFAHWRSKEELQLATIERAREQWTDAGRRPGAGRARAACAGCGRCTSAGSASTRPSALPGGCFFANAKFEFDARARARCATGSSQTLAEWMELLERLAAEAVEPASCADTSTRPSSRSRSTPSAWPRSCSPACSTATVVHRSARAGRARPAARPVHRPDPAAGGLTMTAVRPTDRLRTRRAGHGALRRPRRDGHRAQRPVRGAAGARAHPVLDGARPLLRPAGDRRRRTSSTRSASSPSPTCAPIRGTGEVGVHFWLDQLGETSATYGFRFLSPDGQTVLRRGPARDRPARPGDAAARPPWTGGGPRGRRRLLRTP